MVSIGGTTNQILCSINNAITKLYQAVFVNGFHCVSNTAQILIGTDALLLTRDSISCDTDLSITAPLTKFSNPISTSDQIWSGVIYAKDQINILINPRDRTCAFNTINCNDNTNPSTDLTVTATNGIISRVQNSTTNTNSISCTNSNKTVTCTSNRSYNVSAANSTNTISCTNSNKTVTCIANRNYNVSAANSTNTISCTNSNKTVDCTTDRNYTITTKNSDFSVICTGTATRTVTTPVRNDTLTATTTYTATRNVPSNFADTLVIQGTGTFKLVPLNIGGTQAYVYVKQP